MNLILELHTLFRGFKQAFDKVNGGNVIESMKMLKMPEKLMHLVAATLERSRDSFEKESGLRCTFSHVI